MDNFQSFVDMLRAHSPQKGIPMDVLRQDFSSFYLEHQRDRNPSMYPDPIRDDLPGTWITTPGKSEKKAILFFHGGGFTLGSTADHAGLCSRLADVACMPVFGVDYRLAPEFCFPAQVEDAVDAYRFLLDKGYAPSSVVPVGISAGGTLVLSLLLAARDRNIPLPASAVCMSPAVNMLFEGRSVVENLKTDWITKERLDSIRKVYLHGADPRNPLASPLFADLEGLPPMMIQAGSGELLRDDIIGFVEKAHTSGVKVEFELWDGMFHCWQVFAAELHEGDAAIKLIGGYIRKMIA
jgi:monoterpene epsilon-lactone hydrolase